MRTIWQVGAGMSGSPYHELLIRYGLALIGPGDPGMWHALRSDADFDGGWVRRFATEPKVGDVVLLRVGTDNVVAVGVIASDYLYLEQFDDVHGWDLQHARRVRWRVLPSPQVFSSRVFGANPPRFSRVNSDEVVQFAKEVMGVEIDAWQSSPLPALPSLEPAWESPPQWLNGLIGLAQDWSRMIWQEQKFFPSEDEMLVHFIVPLFRSIGWPQELLAVKWNYIDLAVFHSLPRTPENCCLVVEAKRLGVGAESALKQAVDYAVKLQNGCDVLLTDGFRYRLYSAAQNFEPKEYANLLALKESAARLVERMQYRRAMTATPAVAST